MDFTKEQKKEAFKKLTEKEKDFISSPNFVSKIEEIGLNFKLLLDKTNIINNLVFIFLLGLIKTPEFTSQLKKQISLPQQDFDRLITEINQKILLPFREVLASEETTEGTENTPDTQIQSEREQILAEIENPQPVAQPISTPNKMDPVAKNFIGGKLTETVSLPTQKVEIQLKKPEVKPKYSADPYRENIV